MKYFLSGLLFVYSFAVHCQARKMTYEDSIKQANKKINGYILRARIIEGDTIPIVNLREVVIWAEYVFENEEAAKKYRKLLRDVRRVYPQAIVIAATVRDMKNETGDMSKRERKKYLQQKEDTLRSQFEKAFRTNTVDQAEILIKLIHRETGQTAHQIIKDLKGGFSAFKWQSVSRVVGTNLKDEYDRYGNDAEVEKIILKIEEGVVW